MLRSVGIALAADLAPAVSAAAPVPAEPSGQAPADAWPDGDPRLQGAVSQAALADGVPGLLGPRGAPQSRRPAATKAVSTLPGAPDGGYRALTYAARFADGTQVMRQEPDGWRPSGDRLR